MKFLSRKKQSKNFRFSQHKKQILLAVIAMISLTAVLSVGPIYAYLKMISAPAVNSFDVSPAVNPVVNADYTVSVGDNSNGADDTGYSVYVRAAVVVTWQNASGDVYGSVPACTIPINTSYWKQYGNYYYYNETVPSGGSTQAILTGAVTATEAAPEGYALHVDILVQTIQAVGTKNGNKAVVDAWGVDPSTL